MKPSVEADTTEASLLHAIVVFRQEDTPRLVYADYLDERGLDDDATIARYIRLSIEEARAPGCMWASAFNDTTCRPGARLCSHCLRRSRLRIARDEFDEQHRRWIAVTQLAQFKFWSKVTLQQGLDIHPGRGFVDTLTVPWNTWAHIADSVRDLLPITRISFTTQVYAVAFRSVPIPRKPAVALNPKEPVPIEKLSRGFSKLSNRDKCEELCQYYWPEFEFRSYNDSTATPP